MIVSQSISANHVYMTHPDVDSYAREARSSWCRNFLTFKSICGVWAQIIWGKKAKCLLLLQNKFNIIDLIRLFGRPPPPPPAKMRATSMGVYHPKGDGCFV